MKEAGFTFLQMEGQELSTSLKGWTGGINIRFTPGEVGSLFLPGHSVVPVKPAAPPPAAQLRATSGCSQLEGWGRISIKLSLMWSWSAADVRTLSRTEVRDMCGCSWESTAAPLVRGQYIVNRCQHPKKRTGLPASSGYPRWHSSLLAGIPGHGSSGLRDDPRVRTSLAGPGWHSEPSRRLPGLAIPGLWPPNLTALERIRRWGKEKGKR